MPSPFAERAIEDALKCGKAILKFVSPNDVGITGGHQSGFYLIKSAWEFFTPHPPDRGENKETDVNVTWQDGRVTNSCVHWYGKAKSEYRLTRFGRGTGFPYLNGDVVGDLLVIIPWSHGEFSAYVLDIDSDIEDVQSALGVEVMDKSGAVYNSAAVAPPETEDNCLERNFRGFVAHLEAFPPTLDFSRTTQQALQECIRHFDALSADKRLGLLVKSEYDLFRMAERLLCQTQISRLFASVDDFLKTAQTILQRRRSRAGWSLEHHVEYLLRSSGIPFDMRPNVDGEPDILIPGKEAYEDASYPNDKLFMIGLKTTCKDRWRQVLNEAKRIPHKHILTMQRGISSNQMDLMQQANVTLIVPEDFHTDYPPTHRTRLLSVESFIQSMAEKTNA